MATSTVKQLPKSTAELEINIPWSEIKTTYQEVLGQVTRESEIPGFRKAKAPKEMVEEKIDKGKIYTAKTGEGAAEILKKLEKKHPEITPEVAYLPKARSLILWM